MNEYKLKDILKITPRQRTGPQKFFLRMHLHENVPFFANYSGETLANICGQLQQRIYSNGEIIIKQGDFGDELITVLLGEVGVYIG